MNPDFSVAGFGWKNIYSIHGGLEFLPVERLALRGGYNYTQNPIPSEFAMFNVPAPAIVQHHLTIGLGVNVLPELQISAGYYKALKNDAGGPLLDLASGTPVGTVTNSLAEDSFSIQFSFGTRGVK